ncbi:hypothetical protein GCM10010492_21780 [Saccharothrix mutabilis subsp. mutabilis]|uniref:Uncharacterized protein n=1 Tax=Saccharothrix mutabilis subsp. mutabilis TaxID=66855 RepID=A0ABP3D4N0_9PSEU
MGAHSVETFARRLLGWATANLTVVPGVHDGELEPAILRVFIPLFKQVLTCVFPGVPLDG